MLINIERQTHMKKTVESTSTLYCLGIFGALVYFIQHANTFWEGLLGVLQAIVWPAVLVYKALELLKM